MQNAAQVNQFNMFFTYLARMYLCITFSSRLFARSLFLSLATFSLTTSFLMSYQDQVSFVKSSCHG